MNMTGTSVPAFFSKNTRPGGVTGREGSEDGNALDLVHYEDGAPEHCGYGADAHEIDYCVCDLFHLYPPSFYFEGARIFS